MNQEKIGAFVAMLRREKRYTQRDVADRLDRSEKTISKWECGKGLPEVVYMEPLCSLLGISVNELLVGEHIPILDLLKKIDETRIADHYYDETGMLKQYPSKRPVRMIVLQRIADRFAHGKNCTEKEINQMIREQIAFLNIALIRRGLIDYAFLSWERDGSRYWKNKK